MRSMKWPACSALAVLMLAGCSAEGAAKDSTAASKAATSKTAPSEGMSDAKPALAAEQVSDELAKVIPSFKTFRVYSERDDPNQLMGRPGGYTSKTAFYDMRIAKGDLQGLEDDDILRGGSVEVFDTEKAAKTRHEYVKAIAEASSMFAEYDYLRGTMVVRVSRELTPGQAAEYEAALKNLPR